jgi:hypothetical protein
VFAFVLFPPPGKGKKELKIKSLIPKPPGKLSSYIIFCREKRKDVVKEHPEWDPKEVMKAIGAAWTATSAEGRKPFDTMAGAEDEAQKAKYAKDKPEREKERLKWCSDLGLSSEASWEKVSARGRGRVS